MPQLWQVLLSGVGVLMMTAAKPAARAGLILLEHLNKTCLTATCDAAVNVQHISELQSYVNSEADPCDNFHEYACGNWRKSHANGSTMMKLGDAQLNDKYVALFESWLQEQNSESVQDALVSKMLKYYEVCKASGKEGTLSLKGYLQHIKATDGCKWRLLENSWLSNLAALARYGYSEHFVQVQVKQLNASSHGITVQPHDVEKRVNLSAEIYDVLREYTNKDFVVLQQQFLQLEADLERIMNDSCAAYDCDLMQPLTFEELQQRSSVSNWQLLLDLQLQRQLKPEDTIFVEALATIEQLALYLNRADRALLHLYTLARFLNYLQQQPHNPLVHGSADSLSCMRHMRKVFCLPMTYIYEQVFYSHVRASSDQVVRSIFGRLKAEFALTLARNRMQLPDGALTFLQRKLWALRLNVGNLPHHAPSQFYSDYVQMLNVSNNFYLNHLEALRYFYYHQQRLATMPVYTDPWYTFNHHSPDFPDNLDSTPYYFCLSNIIVVPHAYLQTPFYDQHYWPTLLYGDLATTLGHELIHAFDSDFLQYDEVGNPSEVFQQSIEGNVHYARNRDCLHQGTELLAERIADISGTRLALNAFLRDPVFRQQNGKLFFLQFAQFFCGNDAEVDRFHDSDSLRLNYTLRNLPEFAEVFNCRVGSAMNTDQRCELW